MSPSLPAPRLVEAYEVLEVVRHGGLSTTLRVRHRGNGELRCIDVLRPAPGQREVLERRLDAEARPLMELRHPHVTRLVDAAVGDAGEACIVREDQDGVTLRRLTGSQRPSTSLAVELLRQTSDALAFLHANGRRVGDLSPEGVLLGRGPDGRPQLVLGDLGLAKDWQEEAALTAAGLFIGRLRYAAPEQFEAGGRRSAPGDVYAWGLVAYELLTGRHPNAGDSASSLIAGHLFRPPTDFADTDPEGRVPEELRRLVLSALAKPPDDRPTAAVLRGALEQVQGTLPAIDPSELDRWVDPRRATPGVLQSTTSGVGEAGGEEQLDAWLGEAHALARGEQFVEARDKVRQVLKMRPDHSMGLMLLASLEACLKIQVEESKAHQTLRVSADPSPAVAVELDDETRTVRLPTVKSTAPESGNETVRVCPDDVTQLLSAAQATPSVTPEEARTPRVEAEEMATLRLDPAKLAESVGQTPPPPERAVGSQEPGAPASTERLDLPDHLDDGKTRPLSPDLLRRVSEAEPSSVMPGAATSPTTPATPASPAEFANGTTQLLGTGSDDVRSEPEPVASPMPGTVTLPMEQIEPEKKRAIAAHPAAPTLPGLPAIPNLPGETESAKDSRPVTSQEPSSPPLPASPPASSYPASFAEPEPVTPTPAASVDELGFGGAEPVPLAERAPRGRGRRAKGRGKRRGRRGKSGGGAAVMIAAALAAVLVFAIGYAVAAGVDLRRLVGLDAPEDVAVPSELPPVAAEPGLLLLDAEPWAEIVQVIDSLGEEVPLRFRHTPARYELPPGTYTVIMASADGILETLELEVSTGETTQARPEFSDLDVDDYFRLMGWR